MLSAALFFGTALVMKNSSTRRRSTMTEEILEIVDEENRVTGRAARSRIHREQLRHRAVHIFLFNSQGELFLQKRSPEKDEFPGYYDSSAAGHVDPQESYADAAGRELEEELGVTAALEKIAEFPASRENGWEFTVFYRAVSDEPVRINRAEIAEGCFYPVSEIAARLQREGSLFTPAFKTLFECYLRLWGMRPHA
jgi:isopentenyl-diphosphate Delta-isomerase